MSQRYPRKLDVRSALAALALWAAPAVEANNGMVVPRTVYDTSTNTFTQRGGLALTPEFDRTSPSVLGVWLRNQVDSDTVTGSEDDGTLFSIDEGKLGGLTFFRTELDRADVGDTDNDNTWHYFYISFDGSGNYVIYRDGAQVASGDDGFLGSVGVGSDLFLLAGSNRKAPTEFSVIVDDVSIWDSASAEVLALHADIAKYGMDAFDEGHPNLVAYFSCDSEAEALRYYEDVAEANAAATSFDMELATPVLQAVAEKPVSKVPVTVASAYGAAEVSPAVAQSGDFDFGTTQTFSAPDHVYLDRYFNELGTSLATAGDDAYYRAALDGYALGGASVVTNSASVTITLTAETRIEWFWDLELAVAVDAGTGTLDGLDDGVLGTDPAIGLSFLPEDAAVAPRVNGVVEPGDTTSGDVEFQLEGYIVENLPGAADRYLVLSEGADVLQHTDIGTDLAAGDGTFTVEFWARRDGFGSTSDQNVVAVGSSTSAEEQIRVGFRASVRDGQPDRFFLANNVTGTEADGSYSDREWHHWAVVNDGINDKIYLYRDGVLIVERDRDFIFSGDTVLTVGARAADSADGATNNRFKGGLNNLRIWTLARTAAELRESMATAEYGSGQAGLAVELTFDEADTSGDPWTVTSTEGGGLVFDYYNSSSPFPAGTDAATREAALFPGFGYTEIDAPPAAVQLGQIFLQDWYRVSWRWKKRFLVEVLAADTSGQSTYDPDTLPFLSGGAALDGAGAAWVDEGAELTVGTRYRTGDRCFTFEGISGGAGGDGLAAVADGALVDGTYGGETTRQHTIAALAGPGQITFTYGRTVFRAEVALGSGLDVSSTAALDAQLVPDLCEGGELRRSDEPPTEVSAVLAPGVGAGGENVLWDFVGQQLLPLRPGRFTVEWPDANDPSLSYLVEVVSGFPGETVDVGYEVENDDGTRVGDGAGGYLQEVTFPGVDAAFPGSPAAHYRLVYHADPGKNPPVDLDPNAADRWTFHRQTYTETASGADEAEKTFTAGGDGRSVLLFGYAPVSTDVAVGDTAVEAYAVRVAEAADIGSATVHHSATDETTEGYYAFDGTDQGVLTLAGTPGTDARLRTPHLGTSFDFWARLDEGGGTPGADQAVYEFGYQVLANAAAIRYRFGFRAPDHATNPGGFYFDMELALDQTPPSVEVYPVDFTSAPVPDDGEWHHWALVLDEDPDVGGADPFAVDLYLDGTRVASGLATANTTNDTPRHYTLLGAGSADYPWNDIAPHLHFDGDLDDFRYWREELTPAEVAELAGTARRNPPIFVDPEFAFTFDLDAAGESSVASTGAVDGVTAAPGSGDVGDFQVIRSTHPEVAARLTSGFDTARFGSGWIVNEVSNYNPAIYDRAAAAVGAWGPIYPVNWSGLFTTADVDTLDVAYYENPFLTDPAGDVALHPNVAWPYLAARYDNVGFPDEGDNQHKRITIASRLGTEGVDANGGEQTVFDPALFGPLEIYHQPDRSAAGFNPNEEHALVAPSIRAQLTGETGDADNVPADAAFALQDGGLNVTDESDPTTYTSEPWVLVQFENLTTGEQEMAAYKVEARRDGAELFPALDPETHAPTDALGQLVDQPDDPEYEFFYPYFAGDVLVPPYPLNRVLGNLALAESWGGNLGAQRTLWADVNGNYWCVSGDADVIDDDGEFFFRYYYPFRADFWFDRDNDGEDDIAPGEPVAWLPSNGAYTAGDTAEPEPVIVRYDAYWRDGYPVLKRGETLTYAGGEHFAETAGAAGLPGVVGWASAQLIYDSAWRPMLFDEQVLHNYNARVIRPLDRIEADLARADLPDGLTPAATEDVMVVAERWYFKALTGSLQRRLYYDSLREKLVFRGRLNDLEGGDPEVTARPAGLHILEPNVMTLDEFAAVEALGGGDATWEAAAAEIYLASQDPHGTGLAVSGASPKFYAGVEPSGGAFVGQPGYFLYDDAADTLADFDLAGVLGLFGLEDDFQHLNSLGTGAALVPNPDLLDEEPDGPLYLTLAENNHPDAGGAVALHVIEIAEERFRGAVKVVEAQDVFDEKINLRHTGDFGADTADVFYQWWVREVAALDDVGLPGDGDDTAWQVYTQGLGLHQITFAGRPDIALADKLFYVRYGLGSELEGRGVDLETLGETDALDGHWRRVDLDDPADTYSQSGDDRVPFQWAGAANSPQAQADGSRRFLPQLVMGWVKRVLDRVNPYEARWGDFYNSESPATATSMLQLAGAPFAGKVALNADKDVLENVGLIELYETVLARASELTLQVDGAATAGTDQALLLAATRLATLYELLAREAYADAQDPTIAVTDLEGDADGLQRVAPFAHAFMNQEASVLHEELALLRGTDFAKAYPAHNRLFWNYVKGLGEAAYNVTYNIHDENGDGLIDESDAAALFPQGHGDAWGHFLSAAAMHYDLLGDPNGAFVWRARAELYSLLDNVVEADYLDEKAFARIAAAKARAGAEIVAATYRLAYTEDPAGQWQGYSDSADPARAWGVAEWAKRAGQAAYFDWAVGNALVPADAAEAADTDEAGGGENLHRIDRRANQAELSEVAQALAAVHAALDRANNGANPAGLDRDALLFDIDPHFDGEEWERRTHFEQVYDRAVQAAQNALAAHGQAVAADFKLRRLADDTRSLQIDALRQDIDYRNRLIEIFGTPYEGTIGPGQPFAEGYEGPDTLLYLYLDRRTTDELLPGAAVRFGELADHLDARARRFKDINYDNEFFRESLHYDRPISGANLGRGGKGGTTVGDVFDDYFLTADVAEDLDADITVPVGRTADHAFLADPSWGGRTAYGRVQVLLNKMLLEEAALDEAIRDYRAHGERIEVHLRRVEDQLRSQRFRQGARFDINVTAATFASTSAVVLGLGLYADWAARKAEKGAEAAAGGVPLVAGPLAFDPSFLVRGGLRLAGTSAGSFLRWGFANSKIAIEALKVTLEKLDSLKKSRVDLTDEFLELAGAVQELSLALTEEETKRLLIAGRLQALEVASLEFRGAVAEGFRLLDEREAFNQVIAAGAQRNRYPDMVFRLARNESLTRYQDAFDHAVRYAWLAAKAYDFETSLPEGHPAAATTALESLVKERHLGLWEGGEPRLGQGGLAGVLASLKANFDALQGQLGINNPQLETGRLSLRHEHFRIKVDGGHPSDRRWEGALQARRVDDLWEVPEFVRFCRPPRARGEGALPAIVIAFPTEIVLGRNVFGRELGGGDHTYSAARYATKIRSAGVFFEGYNDAELATTPRVYLVPAGADVLRLADGETDRTRAWNVIEQKIPAPLAINPGHLDDPGFIPSLDTTGGGAVEARRHGDLRASHGPAGTGGAIDPADLARDTRLVGRSAWNTRWLLIIPGAALHADPHEGLDRFVATVTDIQLVFETYSHSGL